MCSFELLIEARDWEDRPVWWKCGECDELFDLDNLKKYMANA
jgi:hypothetical protein